MPLQGVRKGKADKSRYHSLMRKLLADVKRRAVSGQLLSSSVAGHLPQHQVASLPLKISW